MILVFKKSLHAFNTHGVISNNSILFSAVLLAIAAVSIIGISNQEAFAVPPPGGQPAPVVVYNPFTDTVTLTWGPVSATPAVTDYRVFRSTAGGAVGTFLLDGSVGNATTTAYIDSTASLADGVSIVYLYRPINADSVAPNGAAPENSLPSIAFSTYTPIDTDGDLIEDAFDNCPADSNPGQEDTDLDGIGDVCDSTPNGDTDGDGIDNLTDNCPADSNPGQEDTDLDGIGDVCDTNTDTDGDGIDDGIDNCPADPNFDQDDADLDGIGDVCDSTPNGETSSSGGSGCFNCAPPTLGYNNIGKKLVDGGFTYNGKVSDAEYYYTPYPLITVTVGQENVAELKIFEDAGPDAIRHVDLGFGLAKGEHMSESKAVISYDIDFQGNGVISQVDPDNVIDDASLKINHQKVKCMDSSNDERCLLVRIYHTFRDTLDFDIVATNVWDTKRNSWENLFNHGIHITGDSMNPPKQYDGINKGVIYHLTQTSKTSAVDDLGNTWSLQYGVWAMDYKPVVRNDPVNINADKIWAVTQVVKGMTPQQISDMFGYDRHHNKFVEVKDGQMLIAETLMEKVCPDCVATPYGEINNIFYYEIPESMDRLHDIQIINKMKQESDKAQELLLSMK